MKQIIVTIFAFFLAVNSVFPQDPGKFVPLSYEEADLKADSLLRLMTLEEKMDYIGGTNMFYTREVDRLGIPWVAFADATQGVRINPAIISRGMKKPLKKSVAYPSPILLSATWNREMAHQYAHSIGEEARSGNMRVLLGPGFNLYRNSQCGRNFEYMGEDPFLAGNMVARFVTGLQETGTMATLKHFVANQTDYFRKKSNSVLDERTLHEIYLPPFKYGIDAGAKAVMTSYNLVNGEWAGQSDFVINNLLRKQLGFRWLVMTDWFSVWNGEKLIRSGQDLEMPFRRATKKADKLLEEGIIEEADIDRMVKSILRSFIAMGAFDRQAQPLTGADYERLEKVALNTAREGMVLLKNDRQVLPIDKSKHQRILVTGEFLDVRTRGGGAAAVKGYDNMVMKDAFLAEFGEQLVFVKHPTEKQLAEADIVLLSVGTSDREGRDRPFELPAVQEELVRFCTNNNPNTVVIVTTGGGINMSHWENAHTILYTWYMGQNGARAAAEILCGKVNPSGKLPITIEKKFEDSPANGYIPEGEKLYRGAKMRAQKKRDVYDVNYDEGIFVGYRWYDSRNIEPEYCFGHGLSYTSFEYSDLVLTSGKISGQDSLEIKFTLRNTGKRDGAEVVQLYVSDRECSVERPLKELKGFGKISLEAGRSKEVTLRLTPSDFAFWHPETREWTVEDGIFDILIGSSSRDIRLRADMQVKAPL